MRRILVLVGLLLAPVSHADFAAEVTHVRDGDTLECGERVVRLKGIDAPESDQPHGGAAGKALRRLVGGETVRVEIHGRGSYDRIIGTIHHGGRDGNPVLVRQGHAWTYDEYLEPGSVLPSLERRAREADRGLWSRPAPVPPWQWRHGASRDSPNGERTGIAPTSTSRPKCSGSSRPINRAIPTAWMATGTGRPASHCRDPSFDPSHSGLSST